MIREIRKKNIILENRRPFPSHVEKYMEDVERKDWLTMHLSLEGSALNSVQIQEILDGEVVSTGKIQEHLLIERLEKARGFLHECKEQSVPIGPVMIMELADIMYGKSGAARFRKSTPPIIEYGYTPPLPEELRQYMDEFVAFATTKEEFEQPFMKAVSIHNRFIKIYPFSEYNQVIARCLMAYRLLQEGFPLVCPRISEIEYNQNIGLYLKRKESENLVQLVMKDCLVRLEVMVQLTGYE